MWWLLFSCVRQGPLVPAPEPEPIVLPVIAEEPEAGWYNGSCYAALDGDVDVAMALLANAIRRGEAPLQWMGEDADLISVRADPRYLSVRDEAIDAWVEANPPTTAQNWFDVAQARQIQARDPMKAILRAEELGFVHAVFDAPLEGDTPGLQDVRARRAAYVGAHQGTITVEIPEVFELANIVLTMTEYGDEPYAIEKSSAYHEAVEAWFGPHRDHPLIVELNSIPVDMMVYYAFRNQSAAWAFEGERLVPGGVYAPGSLWGNADPIGERREAIEDFARITRAREFLATHRPALDARTETYASAVPLQDMWDWLESHFPAEGDGRDGLLVRSSLLIGGSHNASTMAVDGFTEGTMVVPIFTEGEAIDPVDIGPLARMVFTEIDHHYVNPVSDRRRKAIDSALGDHTRFNTQDGDNYGSPYLTFNEYATWILFDVWWAEWCDENACTPAQREAGEQDTIAVMERRGFNQYTAFQAEVLPKLADQQDLDAMFPVMLEWFAAQP